VSRGIAEQIVNGDNMIGFSNRWGPAPNPILERLRTFGLFAVGVG
jgi:hypothetical protein